MLGLGRTAVRRCPLLQRTNKLCADVPDSQLRHSARFQRLEIEREESHGALAFWEIGSSGSTKPRTTNTRFP